MPQPLDVKGQDQYLNGLLTNEEVIQELLKLAQDIAAANAEGEALGLNTEELAFYDALSKYFCRRKRRWKNHYRVLLSELIKPYQCSLKQKEKRSKREFPFTFPEKFMTFIAFYKAEQTKIGFQHE